MRCPNCGKELENDSKFCGYCGYNNERQNLGESINDGDFVEETTNLQKIEQVQTGENNGVENNYTNSNSKKNSKAWIYIISCIILVIGIVALVLVFTKKTTNTNPVETLEKSIGNLQKEGNLSGTVSVKVLVEDNDDNKTNISGIAKYQKTNDIFNLELDASGFMLPENIKLFVKCDKTNLTLYTKANLLSMFLGETIEEENDQWLYYSLNLNDLELDLSNLDVEDTKIDFSELGIDSKIKYIGKEKNLRHYTFTIDKELIQKIESKIPTNDLELVDDYQDLDDFMNMEYVIDLYVNNSDNLEKISVDFSKYIDDDSIKTAFLTIEFKDLNKTIVTIPSDVSSAINLETYLSSIEIDNDNLEDFSW